MSVHANRATVSLLNMTREMYRKDIEISRITRTSALLLMSGLSSLDIDTRIVDRCLRSQQADGGFVGNTDTLWNIKLSRIPAATGIRHSMACPRKRIGARIWSE